MLRRALLALPAILAAALLVLPAAALLWQFEHRTEM